MQIDEPTFSTGHSVQTTSVSCHNEISISKDIWDNICDKIKSIHISKAPNLNGIFVGLLIPAIIQTFVSFSKTLSFDNVDIFTLLAISALWGIYRLVTLKGKFKPTDNSANKIHVGELVKWVDVYSNRYINQTKSHNVHQE